MINENIISTIKSLPTKELMQIALDMNDTVITDISRSYLTETFKINENDVNPIFLLGIAPTLCLELSNRIPLAFEAGREMIYIHIVGDIYKYNSIHDFIK